MECSWISSAQCGLYLPEDACRDISEAFMDGEPKWTACGTHVRIRHEVVTGSYFRATHANECLSVSRCSSFAVSNEAEARPARATGYIEAGDAGETCSGGNVKLLATRSGGLGCR